MEATRPVLSVQRQSDRCSCGMAVEDRQGRAYDEGAFRYFLALEQQRSTRSGRAFLLVLVYLKGKAGAGARIDTTLAGPVLTELRKGAGAGVARLAARRVRSVLCEGLPEDVARCLHVQVYSQPRFETIESLLSRRPWLGPEDSGDA